MSKGILTQLAKSVHGRDWLSVKKQLFLLKYLSNYSVSGKKYIIGRQYGSTCQPSQLGSCPLSESRAGSRLPPGTEEGGDAHRSLSPLRTCRLVPGVAPGLTGAEPVSAA